MKRLPDQRARLVDLEPFAHVRLIALDIDGTLAARFDDPVADHIRALRNSLQRMGVRVTVATGRAFAGARPVLEVLASASAPVILYNGSVVADSRGQHVIHRRFMTTQAVNAVLHATDRERGSALVYDCRPRQEALADVEAGGTGLVETVAGFSYRSGDAVELNGLRIDWRSLKDAKDVGEATAVLIPQPSRSLIDRVLRESGISATTSGVGYLEVRPPGVTKAAALERIAERLALASEQVLTVGDNDNDVEMLRWAGIGVAVGNASDAALGAAKFVTSRSATAGVIETLRLVTQARRFFPQKRAVSQF